MPKTKIDTKNVQTWISPEAHDALAAAAKADTRSIASFVRRTLYEKLGLAVDAVECATCLGIGKLHDADTSELRKCLDCGGSGRQ